jgi:hypothetical protein
VEVVVTVAAAAAVLLVVVVAAVTVAAAVVGVAAVTVAAAAVVVVVVVVVAAATVASAVVAAAVVVAVVVAVTVVVVVTAAAAAAVVVVVVVSRDISVGIVTGYELDERVSIPAGAREFAVFHSVQTGCHPPSFLYSMYGGSFPGLKRLGSDADHSHPSSVDVKNGRGIPPLPYASLWHSD